MRASLAVVVLVVGCGVGNTSATSTNVEATTVRASSEAPEWLHLSLRYSPRHSLGKRRLDVVTTNDGPTEIVVTGIALRAEHFELYPLEVKTSRIQPGSTVAVKTDFGEVVDCRGRGPFSASVTMEFMVGASGPVQRFDVPVDPEPLDVIRTSDCNSQLVAEAADVAFGEAWTVEGASVDTDLVVGRDRSTETITVASVAGMILFGMDPVTPSAPSVAVLGPDEEEVRIPVRLTLARCDVHAVSQAPDGYSFRAWVAVGESEPILTTVLPHDRLQIQLESFVLECLEAERSADRLGARFLPRQERDHSRDLDL
ncbi:MAG: hypothetical protein WEE53_06115 [Acidimicrobiia bacterium]